MIKSILAPHLRIEKAKLMAERVRFEPTVPLTIYKLYKRAPFLNEAKSILYSPKRTISDF